jgi:PAS domain S-box-containing protein
VTVAVPRRAAWFLWAILLAAVVLPATLFAYLAWRDYNDSWARLRELAEQRAMILHEHALKVFDTQELAMDLLEERISGLDWPSIVAQQRPLHDLMQRIDDRYDQIVGMGLIDPTGKLVVGPAYPLPDIDLRDRDYVQAMASGYHGIFIGRTSVGRVTGKSEFVVARLRRDASGREDGGALLVAVDNKYFVDFWRPMTSGRDYFITMFRADGVILATSDPSTENLPNLPPNALVMAALQREPAQGTVVGRSAIDGVDRLYVYRKLGAHPVYVTYAVSTAALMEPWRQQLVRFGALDLAASLALIAITLLAMQAVRRQERGARKLEATATQLRREVVERERAELEARHSAEDYRFLYQKTPVMLHSTDREGRMIDVGDYWLDQTGYRRDEVLGRKSSEFLTPESRRYNEEVARPVLVEKGGVRFVPLQLQRKDGSVMEILVSSLAQRDQAGNFLRSLAVSFDVTDWRRAEAQLRQIQRMEAVGQLTGGVAHDFNNLLTVIIGNLERAGALAAGNLRIGGAIEAALKGAERAASLTQQLLAFSRKQPLEPRPVDVGKLLTRVSTLLRRTLGEQIEIETVTAGGLWIAFCDAAQLESALLNLAVNARDAMPNGGKLTLEAGNVVLDEEYALNNSEVRAGRYVMVAVSDTGSGMATDVAERAFEPFFTTKPEGKGTGLGLSQVFGFAKQSGGHVKIYSEPGHGTTVKLYLPRTTNVAAAATESPDASLPIGQERVLVVEDEPDVRDTVTATLADLGYTVFAAGGPEEALALLAQQPVELIFTDVVMPGEMSSPEMARRARLLQPEVKVLFTSGYTENSIVHNGRLDEGVELIGKPYKREQLAKRLRRLLDEPSADAAQKGVLSTGDSL